MGEFDGDWSVLLKYLFTDLVVILVLMKGLLFWNRLQLTSISSTTATCSAKPFTMASALAWSGDLLALSILMTSLLTGKFSLSLYSEVLLISSYGMLAIVLLKVGERVHWYVLFHFGAENSEPESVPLALIRASHAIALAILFKPILMKEAHITQGLLSTIAIFLIAQLLLIMITLMRFYAYKVRHRGQNLRLLLKKDHLGLSIRYFGHAVGAALVVTGGSYFSAYLESAFWTALLVWILTSALFILVLSAIVTLAKSVLVPRLDWIKVIDQENNAALAIVEAAIYLSMAALMAGVCSAWF